ncbi:alpha-N-arabinofuranosidase [Herbiconiux sp. CPCC 203407]|uniref:non-reducing end alpha-L-arabinofuranosidase n=1 Tax=Herbiconiux oxytropis TaxID=2970915 RepID=A0AA42BVQ1_9MICO|nr:alpha-N-arabinofuranosidase [Herbiconiux oxytropis]MCS5721589.1 alpha-N-arabinofuranosidase [Herbiconiux oxytropis]MCS5726784.1 alpha-N-arabinofuranosidase [Herbiconiux oxytropis]
MSTARLIFDTRLPIGEVNRRVFGSFVEHLGRSVYDGIYEPGHAAADDRGFRTDVVDLVRELGVSAIRYPGGNFVSGFRWEDSVGPVESRPTRLDLAWHSTETNEVGLHEFASWLETVGSELMLAVNLGTRGTLEALDLLEYSNLASGTALAEQRAAHGRPAPFDVRMWCLGNEMDGPWQLGHRSADDYGKLAAQTAKAMRAFDPSLELVVCGSSSAHMPTFGEWERVVLTHTYDDVDYISCHAYYEEKDGDLGSFLASAVDMDSFIASVVSTIDHVKAVKGSDHVVNISFDEWNVWYNERFEKVDKLTGVDNWPVAPRLLEDAYTVADAVVVGNLLISLLRRADRVTSASLAQLVNVIAPIMTEPGGIAWKQTTFFPFALTSALATGSTVQTRVESDTYETAAYGTVPVVDAVTTHDPETGRTSVFVVNRSQEASTTLSFDVSELGSLGAWSAVTLSDADPYAVNTLEQPERVAPRENTSLAVSPAGAVTVELPAVSWTVISFEG